MSNFPFFLASKVKRKNKTNSIFDEFMIWQIVQVGFLELASQSSLFDT